MNENYILPISSAELRSSELVEDTTEACISLFTSQLHPEKEHNTPFPYPSIRGFTFSSPDLLAPPPFSTLHSQYSTPQPSLCHCVFVVSIY